MFTSKVSTPKASYAGSILQATGNGGIGKRRVAKVLNEPYQHESYGKLIIRLKLHIPKKVCDEIEKDSGVLGEAMTKLLNKAKDGPLKSCRNDNERLERAKNFFSKVAVREQFAPQPVDASCSLLDNTVNNESIVTIAPEPIDRRLENDVVAITDSAPSLPAANIRTPGLEMLGVSPVPPKQMSAVASQTSGSATTPTQHRRVRSDPGPNGSGVNILCPSCGRAHLLQTKYNRVTFGNPVNKTMTMTLIAVVLVIVYAVLVKGYPKV